MSQLKKPSTWLGLGALATAVANVIGGGFEKAELARQGVEVVAEGIASGMGVVPSIFLALGGVLGIVLKENDRD